MVESGISLPKLAHKLFRRLEKRILNRLGVDADDKLPVNKRIVHDIAGWICDGW